MNTAPNRTALPLIAGILNIAIGFIILVMLIIFAIIPALLPINIGHMEAGILAFLILPGMIIAILAIAGGIFAIQKKVGLGARRLDRRCHKPPAAGHSSHCTGDTIQKRVQLKVVGFNKRMNLRNY